MVDASSTKDQPIRIRSFATRLDLFPLRKTAANYTSESFAGDARAAFNVALLAFPQGMAYATIAGLPLSYGLFGSAIASIVGMYFAGSKFIVLGPTNATSVMVMSAFAALGFADDQAVGYISLLLLLVGTMLVIGAYLGVATLIQYISRTVISGYITAAASLIIANQIKKTLGFEFSPGERASTFIDVIVTTLRHFGETHLPSLGLSIATFLIFIAVQRVSKKLPAVHALEDSEARAAIEASHSDDCPRAHDDAVCPTCGGATIGTATAPGYQPVTVLDIRCMVSAVLIPDPPVPGRTGSVRPMWSTSGRQPNRRWFRRD